MKQQKLSFKVFSKKFKLLYIVLTLILVFGIFIFCLIFWDRLYDISAWASMIAGIISYIGSSILGIFVFYHSWVQCVRQDELEDISVVVSAKGNETDSLFLFQEDTSKKQYPLVVSRMKAFETETKYDITKFIKITLANYNYFLPIEIEFTNLHYLNDNNEFVNIRPIKTRSVVDLTVPIDFKEKTEFLVGVPNEVFLERRFVDHSIYYVSVSLKIKNPKSNMRYCTINVLGGNTFRTTIGIFTEEEKDLLEKKYGSIVFLNDSDKSYLNQMCSTNNP